MKYTSCFLLFAAFGCIAIAAPWAAAAAQITQGESPPVPAKPQRMVLAQALSRVIESNPELTMSVLEIHAAAARILQAGLRPNPELAVAEENILAMNGQGLFPSTESTFQLSYRLELGGKRDMRVRAGEMDKAMAGRRLEAKKVELIAATSQAFAEVLTEQERLANRQELSQLAQQAHAIVGERVAAGKVSPVEQTRALVALASAQLEREKQGVALVAAKDRLAALWGGTHQDIDRVEGQFDIPPGPPRGIETCIENSPEMKLAAATTDYRRAALNLEQTSRKPDLTISAGYRHLNLDNQDAWVAAASLPLPLFDKRQGAIAEARILLEKSLSEQKAVAWRLRAGFAQARHNHEIALLEARSLKQTALPAAKEALAATEEGYQFGKFDYLNVLDAQRTYAELQSRYIEAVAAGLKAAIEMERLARCDDQARPADPAIGQKEATYEK